MKKQQDLFVTDLPNVVTKTINEAVNKLTVTGCSFKVVFPNGETVELDPHNWLNPQKELKRVRKERPEGKMIDYYKPIIENMKVGDVVVLDWAAYGRQDLQSAVTAWCCHKWGNGSVTTVTSPDNTKLELLRLK